MPRTLRETLLGCFRRRKVDKAKTERVHPYDEVDESKLHTNQPSPRRRPREYDEIEIDDDASGPTMVDESSAKPEAKTLNYVQVDVQPQSPDAEIKRTAPPTQYTTIDVAATATAASGKGRKVSITD